MYIHMLLLHQGAASTLQEGKLGKSIEAIAEGSAKLWLPKELLMKPEGSERVSYYEVTFSPQI